MIRRDAWRERSRGSLLLLPFVAVVLALGLGVLLSEVRVPRNWPLAFEGTADNARTVLIAISGTMVTVVALVLGLTAVALQLSSTQYSPRLLRNFLRDRSNQVVLSVFVGTFAFSAGGLFELGLAGEDGEDDIPRLAVSVAVALLFLSMLLLVYFADHLTHSLQVDNIIWVVERSTLSVIHSRHAGPPHGAEAAGRPEEPPAVPASAVAVPAGTSGYVQVVHVERLLAAAASRGVHVRVQPELGQHVVAGTPLAWIWPTTPEAPAPDGFDRALGAAVRIGHERTLEQDPGLGLRQLVDVACKALSPAVNDPYTAIQAVEHLTVLLTAMAARPVGTFTAHDPATASTVTVPGRSFDEHLALVVGLVRRYGSAEPTVLQALLRLLATVLTATTAADRRQAIGTQADLLVAAAERDVAEPGDLAGVHAAAAALRRDLAVRSADAPQHSSLP